MDDLPVVHHDGHHYNNSTAENSDFDITHYYIIFIVLYLTLGTQLSIFLYMLFRLCRERQRRRHMVVVLETMEMDEGETNRI